MKDLGTVGGILNSEADFINSKSQIVGTSFACDFSIFDAILWEEGSMVDLNTLIPTDSPFHLYAASFIDDDGKIAAFGSLTNGDTHALLLIPCDENHHDIEDCDFSEAEESGSAIGSRPVAQSATTANPWVSASSMLRSLGRRSMPWYRNFGVQAPQK